MHCLRCGGHLSATGDWEMPGVCLACGQAVYSLRDPVAELRAAIARDPLPSRGRPRNQTAPAGRERG